MDSKDRRRIRLEQKRKERSMRWAKALSSTHCRCDWCLSPYSRQSKHRHDYTDVSYLPTKEDI